MRRSSKLFAMAAAGLFLAALAWALVTQSNLWQSHARPVERPLLPGQAPEVPAPPENATGVVGNVDEGTHKALEKHLQAQRDARKRLDAPPEKRK